MSARVDTRVCLTLVVTALSVYHHQYKVLKRSHVYINQLMAFFFISFVLLTPRC